MEQEVLSLTVADKIFDRSAVPYRHLTDYLDLAFSPEDKKEILRLGKELAESAHNPNSDVPYEQTVAYMGCGMWDLVNRFGEDEARRMFSEKERKAFYPIEVMKNILSYVQPDVLVITCEVRMEGAAAEAAHFLGLQTLMVPDVPVNPITEYADYVCVMSDEARNDAIINKGIKPEKIYVTGQPVFDDDSFVDNDLIIKTKKDIYFDDYKKMVLFLPSIDQEDNPIIVEFLDKLSMVMTDTLFVMKNHPNEGAGVYSNNVKNMVFLENYELKPLLKLADVVIITSSTTGFEAAYMDKPVITVQLPNTYIPEEWDLSRYEFAEKISDINDLETCIVACLDKNSIISRKLKKARSGFENIGNASKNIANIIKNV